MEVTPDIMENVSNDIGISNALREIKVAVGKVMNENISQNMKDANALSSTLVCGGSVTVTYTMFSFRKVDLGVMYKFTNRNPIIRVRW